MDYRTEIEKLAAEINAHIMYDQLKAHTAFAQTNTRVLHVAPWSGDEKLDRIQYWIALHELGHIAHQHMGDPFGMMFGGDPSVTHKEAEAWNWALDRARIPVDDAARTTMGYSMATYIRDMGVPMYDRSVVRRVVDAIGPSPDLGFFAKDEEDQAGAQRFWRSTYDGLASAA